MRLILCAVILAVVTASPRGHLRRHRSNADHERAQEGREEFLAALKRMVVAALSEVSDMPDPDAFPDNFHNSTVEAKTVNGTLDVTNTTVVKSTVNGVQETKISKTEKSGGKLRILARILELKRKHFGRSRHAHKENSSEESSGEDEDMSNEVKHVQHDLEKSLENLEKGDTKGESEEVGSADGEDMIN